MAYSNYSDNFDVLNISSYTGHSSSEDPITPTGLGEESYDFCVEDFLNLEAVTATTATATEPTESYPRFDPNDPLRYFLELGEITPNEYEKWKLVREDPPQNHQPSLAKHKRKTPDFGPGYNSDSDSDSDGDRDDDDQGPTIEYGSGYSAHADEHNDPFDPWNPTPDTTNDRRYTKIVATDCEYMLSRFAQSAATTSSAHPQQLSNSFGLKLAWERFAMTTSREKRLQTLQDFWQANALTTYEALQDLRADHARIRGNRLPIISHHPLPPQYHSTPIETLENTFETIGRMCRCIAEDFNTQSVVNYVEEFIVSLYREIEFNALIEAHENSLVKAEWERQEPQQ
jgi:hypothetical protein